MSIAKKAKEFLKDLLLGTIRPAQKFFLGQQGPQQEITVWLHGMAAPLDVTNHHSLACASPLTICVAFEKGTVLGTPKPERSFPSLLREGRQSPPAGHDRT